MKKEVTLNSKEQKRLMVMNEIVAGRITGQQDAKLLRLKLNVGYTIRGNAMTTHSDIITDRSGVTLSLAPIEKARSND